MDVLFSVFVWRRVLSSPAIKPRTVIVGTLAFAVCCLTWRTFSKQREQCRLSSEELVGRILAAGTKSHADQQLRAQVRTH